MSNELLNELVDGCNKELDEVQQRWAEIVLACEGMSSFQVIVIVTELLSMHAVEIGSAKGAKFNELMKLIRQIVESNIEMHYTSDGEVLN